MTSSARRSMRPSRAWSHARGNYDGSWTEWGNVVKAPSEMEGSLVEHDDDLAWAVTFLDPGEGVDRMFERERLPDVDRE